MAAIEVLCLNGRRQKVKITPNTKILQILEEVCTKQDFLPVHDYELRHGRKVLDVTLSVRYAGLPNHAKLELAKASQTRQESDVTLLLQVPSGDRLQHTFPPATMLWQVIQHWESQENSPHKGMSIGEEGTHPVCTYMREEVVGRLALENTSLRQMGLTGGKALFRLLHRPVSEETLTQIQKKIEKEKMQKEKLESKLVQRQTSNQSVSSDSASVSNAETNQMETDSHSSKPQTKTETRNGTQRNMDTEQSMDTNVQNKEEPMDTSEQEQSRSREAQPSPAVGSSQARDPIDELNDVPGITVIRPGQFPLTPQELQEARQLAAVMMPGILPPAQASTSRQPDVRKKMRMQPPIEEFKFPEATKGKEVYQNEFSNVKKEEYKPCERETVIYNSDKAATEHSATSHDVELPDDFFEVTESDIRKMMADQSRKSKEMEEQMLMTSAMRKHLQEQKMAKYERAVIRLHFPDRMVVQAVFRPKETVFALQKFVKDHLEDKDMPFYLYTTPPKCVLKDVSQTLIEANLAPMSVVHFGTEQSSDSYISSSVLQETKSQFDADKIVHQHMSSAHQDGAGPSGSGAGASGSSTDNREVAARLQRQQQQPKSSSAAASGSGKKVPKWFKIGK